MVKKAKRSSLLTHKSNQTQTKQMWKSRSLFCILWKSVRLHNSSNTCNTTIAGYKRSNNAYAIMICFSYFSFKFSNKEYKSKRLVSHVYLEAITKHDGCFGPLAAASADRTSHQAARSRRKNARNWYPFFALFLKVFELNRWQYELLASLRLNSTFKREHLAVPGDQRCAKLEQRPLARPLQPNMQAPLLQGQACICVRWPARARP